MKTQIIATVILMIIMATTSSAQNNWAISGGATGADHVSGVCKSANGRTIVAGMFAGNLTSATGTINSVAGSTDLFINVYDDNNTLIFTKTFGNTCNEQINSMATNAAGDIYITGSYYNTLTFDNISIQSQGGTDIFVASFNSSGNVNWVKSFGGVDSDEGKVIKSDLNSNIYLAAITNGYTFPLSDQVSVNTSLNIVKINSDGDVVWSNCENTTDQSIIEVHDVYVDNIGNIFATGNFSGTVEAGQSGSIILNSSDSKMYLAKYNAYGNSIYFNQTDDYNGTTSSGTAIALNSDNEILVVGNYQGTIELAGNISNALDKDIFIAKFDINGNAIWSSFFQSSGYQTANKIAVNASNQIAVAGYFLDDLNFPFNQSTNNGGLDAFILFTDESGNNNSVVTIGGSSDDYIQACSVDGTELIIAGSFNASMTVAANTLISNGSSDYFIAGIEFPSMSTGFETIDVSSNKPLLYPNPASEQFSIKSTSNLQAIEIFTLDGKLMIKTEILNHLQNESKVDISTLTPGIYLIKIITESGIFNSKLEKI